MKLCPPYKGANLSQVTQGFGENKNSIQPNGHSGVDFAFPNCYGKFLVAPCKCIVKRIITDDTFDNEFYNDFQRGYGILMEDWENKNINYLYWHCMQIFPVKVGQMVEQGQVVAQIGNSGLCYSGGILVPLADRKNGKGAHLHYERRDLRMDYEVTNVLPYIDWDIPVNYNVLQTIQQFLTAMLNLIKNRK